MKIASAWCALGLLALGHAPLSWAAGSSGDIEKAITALEEKWTQGERENNPELIAPILAEGFVVTESSGEVNDRKTFLAEEKDNHYASSDIESLKIHVYGNTAIATYALHQKYTMKGKAVDAHTRETDTWVKMPDGAWQCVAAHNSKIEKP